MFFNLGDKRMTYVLLAILVVMHLSRGGIDFIGLIFSIPAILVAITFHEFAHAYAADKLGDDTPRNQGRLNLNPISHLDPLGSVMLILAGIGWGKPVEINPRNFNRNRSMAASEAIVAFAGPLMNFILAIVFSLILAVIMKVTNNGIYQWYYALAEFPSTALGVVIRLLTTLIFMNVGLGLFNLIPLPPLDGSKILRNFLPSKARNWYDMNYQILYICFLVMWIMPFITNWLSYGIGFIEYNFLNFIFILFGIN